MTDYRTKVGRLLRKLADRIDPPGRPGRARHLVIAGHYVQAEQFAHTKGWDTVEWSHIDRPDRLSGLIGPLRDNDSKLELHVVGTYRKLDNLDKFKFRAEMAGFDTSEW